MEHFQKGKNLDILQRYNEAILAYEDSIAANEAVLASYINLAMIYWLSSTSIAWADTFNIDSQYRLIGYDHALELLYEENLCSTNLESQFWIRYFKHRTYFDPFDENEVLEFVSNDEKDIIPYFFLYLFDFKKYETQRNKLIALCMKELTAKNIYILSILLSTALEFNFEN